MNLTPARLTLLLFTAAYIVAGTVYLLKEGNTEFLGYVVVLVALLVAGFYAVERFDLPLWMLWLVSILGALHLAGGALKIDGDVLYGLVLIPIQNPAGLTIWKFDQLVHPYGAASAALITYALLSRSTTLSKVMLVLVAFMVANGAGALNEVIEFVAKLTVPDSGVGGYYNIALDLTFNMAGALIGSVLGVLLIRRKS